MGFVQVIHGDGWHASKICGDGRQAYVIYGEPCPLMLMVKLTALGYKIREVSP